MSRRDEVEAEIRKQAAQSVDVRDGMKNLGEQVVQVWRSYSPVRSGRYAASVRVLKSFTVDGMPAVRVGSTSRRAHLIEFGTGEDSSGKDPRYIPALGVQVSRDTPTPAFAPRAKTAKHFGGDETPAPKDTTTSEDEQ